jgi:hypothetical protein
MTILAAGAALLFTACAMPTDPVPNTSGGPLQCNYMGTLYDDGAEFPAADGCNSCKCNPGNTPGRWGCSLKLCADAGPEVTPPALDGPVQCNYMGTLYDDGAEFPAADGCNSCKCNPGGSTPGQWGCSLKGCSQSDVPEATSDAGGHPTFCQGTGGQASHGSILPQGDSCCACSAPGTSAPQLQCTPKVTTVKCNYNGTLHDDGAVFPAGDGCNTCKCNPSGCSPGAVGCSAIGCPAGSGS